MRCRRNGHVGPGTYDYELARRIRAAYLERKDAAGAADESLGEPWT